MTRKTTEQFYNDVLRLGNGEYKLIGEYTKSTVKVKIKHLTCNTEYSVTPKEFIKGTRCRKCALQRINRNNTHSVDEYKNSLTPDILERYDILYDGYKNVSSMLSVTCKICGTQRFVRADALKRGVGCKTCNRRNYHDRYTLSTAQYAEKVLDLSGNTYRLVGEYTGVKNKIRINHLVCGNTYETYPYLFNKGRRCPFCQGTSLGEENTRLVLKELGVNFTEQVSFSGLVDVGNLTYDFFIPDSRILIEYQGIQHYKPVDLFGGEKAYKLQVSHDHIKMEFAKHNCLNLICIPYTCNTVGKIRNYLENLI